jgi:ABC-type polysaccharide/polyol phosphate export permease
MNVQPNVQPAVEMSPEVAEPVDRAAALVEVNPQVPLLRGPVEMLKNLRRYRHLAANFVVRDLRLKYRDSALGYCWSLLEPLLLTAVYYFLFVVLAGRPDPRHVVWIILGVITWQLFAKALGGAITCLTRNEAMIKQVYFPRELFAFTSVCSQLVFATLSLLVAVPLMIYFSIAPTVYLLMVPLGLVLAAMLALGTGLTLACLNVINRDVEHLMKFVTRAGMFLSPVLWTIDMIPRARETIVDYVRYNPMTVPITLVRNGIAGQPLGIGVGPIVSSVGFAVVVFTVGAIVFRRFEAQVVKKL